jgi:hypothetical protein
MFKPKENARPALQQVKLGREPELRTQENTYEEWAKLYGKNGLYEQPVTNNR